MDENALLQMVQDTQIVGEFFQPLTDVFKEFEINTPARQAMFMAQVLHESAMMKRLEENLNYSAVGLAKTWPHKFSYQNDGKTPNSLALSIAGKPQDIANNAYSGMLGNGDVGSGDGWTYRGRGLIQITGKDNYMHMGRMTGIQCLADPDLLLEPVGACRSAGAFWANTGLNHKADIGDLVGATRVINGGSNGLPQRMALWTMTKKILGV